MIKSEDRWAAELAAYQGGMTIDTARTFLRAFAAHARHQEPTPHPLSEMAARVHHANKKWWVDINTGEPIKRNIGELLMLVTSELAEALEGDRKNLPDDKLPHRKMFDVEIIDALIRLFDICGGLVPHAAEIFEEKMAFNAVRKDHTIEHRRTDNGKKY